MSKVNEFVNTLTFYKWTLTKILGFNQQYIEWRWNVVPNKVMGDLLLEIFLYEWKGYIFKYFILFYLTR